MEFLGYAITFPSMLEDSEIVESLDLADLAGDVINPIDGLPYLVLEVTCRSSLLARQALQIVELCYEEDLNWDARYNPETCDCQNSDGDIPPEKCYRGFVFLDPCAGKDDSAIICGACIFQWHPLGQTTNVIGSDEVPSRSVFSSTRHWEDHGLIPCWALQWVWFLSRYRRRGMFSSMWPSFIQGFGEFFIEPEYSIEFVQFLESLGYTIDLDASGEMRNWSR